MGELSWRGDNPAPTTRIGAIEAGIGELRSELLDAVDAAQEIAAYEPEEGETVTAAVIKKALKELIDDRKNSTGASAEKARETLQAHEKAITDIENKIKASRVELKKLVDELQHKLQLKRLGADDFKSESKAHLAQIETRP